MTEYIGFIVDDYANAHRNTNGKAYQVIVYNLSGSPSILVEFARHSGYDTISKCERIFHLMHPTGYICPSWVPIDISIIP